MGEVEERNRTGVDPSCLAAGWDFLPDDTFTRLDDLIRGKFWDFWESELKKKNKKTRTISTYKFIVHS